MAWKNTKQFLYFIDNWDVEKIWIVKRMFYIDVNIVRPWMDLLVAIGNENTLADVGFGPEFIDQFGFTMSLSSIHNQWFEYKEFKMDDGYTMSM